MSITTLMKKTGIICLFLIFTSCSQQPATGTFGEKFENKGAIDFKQALASYQAGKDTTYIITGKIENVCSHKGCWISFKNDSAEFYVNTDERFTMPKNSKGKKAIAKGKFVKSEEGEIGFNPSGVIIED
jgi:hypothetical protein